MLESRKVKKQKSRNIIMWKSKKKGRNVEKKKKSRNVDKLKSRKVKK